MKGFVLMAGVILILLASPISADCSGTCTYYSTGSNLLMSWNLDLQCQGKSFSYSGANAVAGAFTYLCGSSSVSCVDSSNGQMNWFGTGRPTLTGASVQAIYGNSVSGSAIGNRIQCNAVAPPQPPQPTPPQPTPPQPTPPGPQPPGPQPPGPSPQPPGPTPPAPSATPCPPTYCSSFTVSRAQSSDPLAGRTFNANCVMNVCGVNSYGCPSTPQWSASYGTVNPATGSSTFWTQSGTSTVTISATVAACGTAQTDYAPATCTLSGIRTVYWTPSQQTDLSSGSYSNPATGREFQALCSDQYGETFPCPGPISWTATAGSFTSSPYHSGADYTYWLASGTTTSPVSITATSSTCGPASTSYALPACTQIALNPRPIPLTPPAPDLTRIDPLPTENLEFNLQCQDQYNERYPCPAAPAWTIQSGTLTTSTHEAATDTYVQGWNATSVHGPFNFTASVSGCSATTWTYRPPAVCAGINLSYGPTTTEEFALAPGYTSTGAQFQWSPNGLENYMQDLPGKFWGYNWTIEWRDRPTPDWVPYRIFGAACNDQYGQPYACPPRYWNATSGYFENTSDPLMPRRFGLPANAVVWRSGNRTERTNVTAAIPYCGRNTLSFDLYVHNACRVLPDPAVSIDLCAQYPWLRDDPFLNASCTMPIAKLPNGGAGNFTALCRDDAGQWLNCLEPNFAWLDPNTTAHVTSTNYWQHYQYYNETGDLVWRYYPAFMGNSVVTLTANETDAFTILTAGGPTHNCKAGVIIGNPAAACDITLSNATPQAGQAVEASIACRGLDGPTQCPPLEHRNNPFLIVEPTSDTTANVTVLQAGLYNLTFGPEGMFDPDPYGKYGRLDDLPFRCNARLNVTPSLNLCSILPRSYSFSGDTTNFELIRSTVGHLQVVPNMVLDRRDVRLSWTSDVYACGQDFDGGIRTQPGFIALDKTRFHASVAQPSQRVTVTMKNLPFDQFGSLYVFDGFAPDAYTTLRMGQDCVAASRCRNLQFDAASRTLTFEVDAFSSYAASGDNGDAPTEPLPPSVRFELDCPLPQLGQNRTRTSAFLYVNGTPVGDADMTLEFELNASYAFQTYPVAFNPATGKHDFIIDTPYGGVYNLRAYSGNYSSNGCLLEVFEKESTPIPELSEWLILAVFLTAGFLATRRKNR